ncbi:MAG: hypothetical protein WAT19_03310 [Ferruginibacter sp.]
MKFLFFSLYIMLALNISCSKTKAYTHTTIKDLDEAMIDLRAYQEALGEHIKSGNLKDADWLYTGMDSVLQVLSNTFPTHRKLKKPFKEYVDVKLKKPLAAIGSAIEKNDTSQAQEQYRILVRRCNSCHKDLEIDKQVWE